MTVAELILVLQGMPSDAPVFAAEHSDTMGFCADIEQVTLMDEDEDGPAFVQLHITTGS